MTLPDGSDFFKTVSGSGLKVDKQDKTSMTMSDGDFVKFIPNDKHGDCAAYSVRMTVDRDLTLEFQFTASVEACRIKDGKTLVGDGYVHHRFVPFGYVSGSVQQSGKDAVSLSGTALFVHGVQKGLPHQLANRWDFMSVQHAPSKLAVIMMSFETPKTFDRASVVQGIVVKDGRLVGMTMQGRVSQITTHVDADTGYSACTFHAD
jgi:hypothetical protein